MADRVRMNTAVAGDDRAGADAVVLARRARTCCAASRWTATATTPATGSTRIDWTGQESTFGRGLPPAADNQAKWVYQQPLLADPALKPTPADIAAATAQAQDLLRLRSSTPLFRLGSADLIEQR